MQSDLASSIWPQCQALLRGELPEQQFNTWIRPLVAHSESDRDSVQLVAPNRFIEDWVKNKFSVRIHELMNQLCGRSVMVEIVVTVSHVNGDTDQPLLAIDSGTKRGLCLECFSGRSGEAGSAGNYYFGRRK